MRDFKAEYRQRRSHLLEYLSTYKKANRAKVRSWVNARGARVRVENMAIIADAKASGCVDCGATDPRILEFDHVRGTKTFTISAAVSSRSPVALRAEIAKCDVRCANCHRIQTWERGVANGWPKRKAF